MHAVSKNEISIALLLVRVRSQWTLGDSDAKKRVEYQFLATPAIATSSVWTEPKRTLSIVSIPVHQLCIPVVKGCDIECWDQHVTYVVDNIHFCFL